MEKFLLSPFSKENDTDNHSLVHNVDKATLLDWVMGVIM